VTEKALGVDSALHEPVMLQEAINALAIKPDGVYVDGTFGRGGHSGAIYRQLGAEGRLIAFDRDPDAIAAGEKLKASTFKGVARFDLVHSRFSEMGNGLQALGVIQVDGMLLDLGVSSPQLDDASRGFSFKADGPLDMRMDPTQGISVRDWLMQASVEQITEVVKDYGEERFAFSIATAIVARCRDSGGTAFQTTRELAGLVASIVRSRQKRQEMGKDPATRTFQALRIFINQEFEELSLSLDRSLALLKPGARLAVISFHSLEDRIVKKAMARFAAKVDAPRDPITGAVLAGAAKILLLDRLMPTPEEVERNPRSRSAVLRVAQRTEAALDGVDRGYRGFSS
jgi:16S rRNA (cytosine1402-N4)-methyltransferase